MKRTPAHRALPRRALAALLCGGAALLSCPATTAQADDPADAAREPTAGSAEDDMPDAAPGYLAPYAHILEHYTRSVPETVGTTVDYRALLRAPGRESWSRVIAALDAASTPTTWDTKLALWINAYNILAIDMVLRHYPIDSIRDIGSFFSPVWRLDAGSVADERVSLHRIEHQILRPMGDPRIHAAIVCASTSCPSLWREPYRASDIQAQLERAMQRWLASPEKGLRVDRSENAIVISPIFDWFSRDWDAQGGTRATLLRYAPTPLHDWLERNGEDAKLSYLDYDWSLNQGDATPHEEK